MERWNGSPKKIAINNFVDRKIKWTSELESYLKKGTKISFDNTKIIEAFYRPFIKHYAYFDRIKVHRAYQMDNIFQIGENLTNKLIWFKTGSDWNFFTLALNNLIDILPQGGAQCLPFFSFTNEETRKDNISDWALQLFQEHYQQIEPSSPVCYANSPEVREEFKMEAPAPKPITNQSIFYYVYAVLHNPAYRKKYELNLKREFPRIPLYENFWQWGKWGEQLMNLHINYETAAPYPLQQKEIATKEHPKAKLRAIKEDGIIVLDDNTELHGIPSIAWEYKLGNRSALEWILDQYKEKKPKDPTIAEKFNTYKFADYKEHVIDLLKRVCTVSVETTKLVGEMNLQDYKPSED